MPDAMTTGAVDEVISVETRRAREIWKQTRIPVVLRRGGKNPLMVKFPYAPDNRDWLREGHRTKPDWNEHYECWELPRSWFEDVTQRLLRRYNKVYIIQPFRLQDKCAPKCWNAKSLLCECSCMGERHGSGDPPGKWYIVSETFAVQWKERRYACRLITLPPLRETLPRNR
jgi:hypothetical protein